MITNADPYFGSRTDIVASLNVTSPSRHGDLCSSGFRARRPDSPRPPSLPPLTACNSCIVCQSPTPPPSKPRQSKHLCNRYPSVGSCPYVPAFIRLAVRCHAERCRRGEMRDLCGRTDEMLMGTATPWWIEGILTKRNWPCSTTRECYWTSRTRTGSRNVDELWWTRRDFDEHV